MSGYDASDRGVGLSKTMVKRKLTFPARLPPHDLRPNRIWLLILDLPVVGCHIFKHGRWVGVPTLFPSTLETSTTLLTRLASRALGSIPSRILHHLLHSLERCRHRHGRLACSFLLVGLVGRRGSPAVVIVVAAVHAAGGGHPGHGGARRPPGEANLRVEMLL